MALPPLGPSLLARAGRLIRLAQYPQIVLWPALMSLCVVALYMPSMGRGFVSEDFVIFRLFYEAEQSGGLWALAFRHFTDAWLGITVVSFYRPLSSLILQLEWLAFGPWATGYLWAHLLVHLGNTFLVKDLLFRLRPPGRHAIPHLAAGIFALYPLHPNTVVFIASFATLWAGTFMLLCVRFYLERRRIPALLMLTAALLCYEQAVILPVCLLVLELASSPDKPWHRALWSRVWQRQRTFWILLLAYLGIRSTALGQSIGGYDSFRARMTESATWLDGAFSSLGRMVFPFYGSELALRIAIGAMSAVTVAIGVLWLLGRRGPERLALIGLIWMSASMAPFSFVDVVPGNGRYAYFGACGLAMLCCALADALTRRSRTDTVPTLCLLALCLVFGAELWRTNSIYARAGDTAEQIRLQALELLADETAPRVFVTGVPDFLQYRDVPTAQIFHWGLADALMPPFAPPGLPDVFPLPEGVSLEVAGAAGTVLHWHDGLLSRPAPSTTSPILKLQTLGRTVPRIPADGELSYRSIVVTRGSYHTELLVPGADGTLTTRRPTKLIQSMNMLYRPPSGESQVLWWVEARTPTGELRATGLIEPT